MALDSVPRSKLGNRNLELPTNFPRYGSGNDYTIDEHLNAILQESQAARLNHEEVGAALLKAVGCSDDDCQQVAQEVTEARSSHGSPWRRLSPTQASDPIAVARWLKNLIVAYVDKFAPPAEDLSERIVTMVDKVRQLRLNGREKADLVTLWRQIKKAVHGIDQHANNYRWLLQELTNAIGRYPQIGSSLAKDFHQDIINLRTEGCMTKMPATIAFLDEAVDKLAPLLRERSYQLPAPPRLRTHQADLHPHELPVMQYQDEFSTERYPPATPWVSEPYQRNDGGLSWEDREEPHWPSRTTMDPPASWAAQVTDHDRWPTSPLRGSILVNDKIYCDVTEVPNPFYQPRLEGESLQIHSAQTGFSGANRKNAVILGGTMRPWVFDKCTMQLSPAAAGKQGLPTPRSTERCTGCNTMGHAADTCMMWHDGKHLYPLSAI